MIKLSKGKSYTNMSKKHIACGTGNTSDIQSMNASGTLHNTQHLTELIYILKPVACIKWCELNLIDWDGRLYDHLRFNRDVVDRYFNSDRVPSFVPSSQYNIFLWILLLNDILFYTICYSLLPPIYRSIHMAIILILEENIQPIWSSKYLM